jgi:ubiquinone/menaquinone biosynthesis C-methylase UbiE
MSVQSMSYETENYTQFDGFADLYDTYRPQMPQVIIDILTQLAQQSVPHRVVDLGCGTGLSTRVWAKRAKQIVGIEPSHDMRTKAAAKSKRFRNISYQNGTSIHTKLPPDSADIVTICQALHWVEPFETFTEVHRILRPGGIFAAIDYDLPSTTTLEISELEKRFLALTNKLVTARRLNTHIKIWDKAEHLRRMETSGQFRYIKEIAVHNKEPGDADRIVGFNLSHSITQTLLKHGLTEQEIGIDDLREQLQKQLGKKSIPMYFTYTLRIGQI